MPLILGILAQGVGAAPGAAGAYDLLETQVLSSSAASVTFTGLGSYSDYKHLQVRIATRSTLVDPTDSFGIQLNNDTGSNYRTHELEGNGSAVSSGTRTGTSMRIDYIPAANNSSNQFGAYVMDFLDFSSSNKTTTLRHLGGFHGSAWDQIALISGLWNNTSAVTSIKYQLLFGGSFITGSRFSLYGVRG